MLHEVYFDKTIERSHTDGRTVIISPKFNISTKPVIWTILVKYISTKACETSIFCVINLKGSQILPFFIGY